ncbi:MAG TPA: SDR family NAD(P)-dependent oxidoreductase [Pseudosphingobacterium sp.]|nr:SDR family NAD(P)-dependent oxidoreductase [Pseudosphingobacterium sp.]
MAKSVLIVNVADSFNIATKFGRSGYQVGVIGRNPEKMKRQQASLLRKEIISFFVVADPASENQLRAAITALQSALGKVDLLVYRPITRQKGDVIKKTVDNLAEALGPIQTKVLQLKKPIKTTSSHEGRPSIQPMSIICGFGVADKGRCFTFGIFGY